MYNTVRADSEPWWRHYVDLLRKFLGNKIKFKIKSVTFMYYSFKPLQSSWCVMTVTFKVIVTLLNCIKFVNFKCCSLLYPQHSNLSVVIANAVPGRDVGQDGLLVPPRAVSDGLTCLIQVIRREACHLLEARVAVFRLAQVLEIREGRSGTWNWLDFSSKRQGLNVNCWNLVVLHFKMLDILKFWFRFLGIGSLLL